MSKESRREFLKKAGTISLVTAAAPLAGYGKIPFGVGSADTPGFLVNPIPSKVVNAYFQSFRLYWGDIHAHTGYSDGYGSAHEFYQRARYREKLDFAAMSDHGEYMKSLNKAFHAPTDPSPDIWELYRTETKAHNHEGEFVTLIGVEWSGKAGHRNVIYKGFDNLPPYPPVNRKSQPTPAALWDFLDRHNVEALTIPHHSSSLSAPTDWSYNHERERLVEIYSEWGNSEDHRSATELLHWYRIDPKLRMTNRAHFVSYALHSGLKLGIIAGTDNHQGLAGSCRNDAARGINLAKLVGIQGMVNSDNFTAFAEALKKKGIDTLGKYLHIMKSGYTMDHRTDNTTEHFKSGGGIAGVFATSHTNRGIWNGLWDRRTYGTTGPRPRVKFCVRAANRPNDVALMGGELETKRQPELLLSIRNVELGTRIREIQIVKNCLIALTIPFTDADNVHEISLSMVDQSPPTGVTDCYNARIQLEETINHDGDGIDRDKLKEYVWTSPVWVTRTA